MLCVAFSIAMLSACQNNSKSINQDADVRDTIVHHEEHAQQASPVSLNNGKKWIANAETTEGIKKMTALMTEFTHHPKADDYRSLKVKLEAEFNLVIQKCTTNYINLKYERIKNNLFRYCFIIFCRIVW